jgi:Carbohydrate binding domain/PEP-CTERM motif
MRDLTRNSMWIAVALAALGADAKASFIVNGDFETGNLTGWTSSQGTANVLNQSVTSVISHTGTYSAALGNQGGVGVLSQMVTGLLVGTSYDLTFWLRSDGDTPNRAAVQIGGDLLDNRANIPAFPFREFDFTFTATSTSELLQFGTRDDPGFLELDDVSITPHAAPVPEPSSLCLLLIGGGASLGVGFWRRRAWREGVAALANTKC